jgi:hypothetical protein
MFPRPCTFCGAMVEFQAVTVQKDADSEVEVFCDFTCATASAYGGKANVVPVEPFDPLSLEELLS